jgi:phosphatidyl-myo-inositol alpha-mannosyltransferase
MVIGLLLDDTLDRADGVQQAVTAIGKELTIRGHEVHYIVTETERTDLANIHSLSKFVSLEFNGNSVRTPLPISKQKITKLFNEITFDILHVQMPFSPFLSARIIKSAPDKTKIFGTFHILPYSKISSFGTSALGVALSSSRKKFTKSFAVSKPALEFMENSFGMSGEIIPNPVDYKFYNSFKKQNLDKNIIVYVGRFEARKGVFELVKAYSQLPVHIKKSHKLIMCGKGPLLDNIKQISKDQKLNIEFPGFVTEKEKAQYLANATIAVFPSKSGESFGIVLTEAMSAGAEITIGGNNPGYASVLAEWPETLFDPSNVDTFSAMLQIFIENHDLRLKIGKKQHQTVKQFDINKIVDKLETYY